MTRASSAPLLPSVVMAILLVPAAALPSAGRQDAPLAVGAGMPGFELQSLDGEVLRPDSLQGDAALVAVFFRGAW